MSIAQQKQRLLAILLLLAVLALLILGIVGFEISHHMNVMPHLYAVLHSFAVVSFDLVSRHP